MIRRWLFLLPFLAVCFAHPAFAEDMPALDNYDLPPRLFDEAPAANSPFLTGIEPEKLDELPKKQDPAPVPPKKPKAPVVKAASQKVLSRPLTKKNPAKPVVKKPKAASPAVPDGPLKVVNPNVKDILASIEGIEPVKAQGNGRVTLQFLPGDTTLTLDMKNILLRSYIPSMKQAPDARIEVHAYALPDKTGDVGARRVSLARALETRDFLIAAGLDSGRIDIMAEGNKVESDHVELIARYGKD